MDVLSYLDREFICPYCKNKHRVSIKEVRTKSGAIKEIADFVTSAAGKNIKKVLVLADNITWKVAGEECAKILKKKFNASSLILCSKDKKKVSADEKYLTEILKNAGDKDCIITVGTGTITDLGKCAGDTLKIPVISIPTAPSMNAYTSGVSAIIKKGVKYTFPTKPVIGVLVDTDIIYDAPLDLIKAGFADSLAKSFATADWKISSLITDEPFCPLPSKIVSEIENKYITKGDKLIKRDRQVIESLMEGLIDAGISMLIAGKSSPASGGEHLISHFLDMTAHQEEKEVFAYHGIQVGVGTLVSSIIYERLKAIPASGINKMLSYTNINYEDKLNKIESIFPKGASSIRKEFEGKMSQLKKLKEKLPSIWEQIQREVFPFVTSSETIKKHLKQADCPLTFKELGVDKETAYNSITLSRYIRGRLTVLDVADELGVLEEIAKDFLPTN